MRVTRIKEIRKETERIKTYILEEKVDAIPGQFVMVWIPDVDEKPLSLSYHKGDMGITVLAQGPFTNTLAELKVGDKIGIRGPFGRGFKIVGDNLLLVGGGVGVPPLAALADEAIRNGKKVTAILGAITKSELLFVDRLEKAGARVLTCTDDGTCGGTKGFTTDVLRGLLEKETFDQCYTCGPEIMMLKVLQEAKKKGIPTQISVERYIKCGIGICGHCIVDGTGQRVCKEGPVFRDVDVEKISEFGEYHRDASGTRIYFRDRK